MDYPKSILTFPPNRVWRTYPGGRLLDEWAGKSEPRDTHFPEDWIGSTTQAVNPGREAIPEGVSIACWPDGEAPFNEILEAHPLFYLGADHIEKYGLHPMVLTKLLDSAVRLHLQCHPTAAFAREHLASNSGKAEAYYILSVREGIENPYVYLGFQRPPQREALKRMIESQDIEALEKCFDKVPVRPGDVLFIPGGYPHAIGEGILMVEIMEPSDLAVRFEFEKAGYTLPESARFMGKGLDFCLDIFDYRKIDLEEVKEHYLFEPTLRRKLSHESAQYDLIGESTTPCFKVRKTVLKDAVDKKEAGFYVGIVVDGEIEIDAPDALASLKMGYLEKFFVPAGIHEISIRPTSGTARILEIYPPA